MGIGKPRLGADASGGDILSRTLEDLRGQREPSSRIAPRRDLKSPALGSWSQPSRLPDDIRALVAEREPRRRLGDLVLAPEVKTEVAEFVGEFCQADLLRSHSLEPRHKLLLIGPPGNGKTSLAETLAFEAGLPFLTVRYEAVLNSYLGESASRLKRLMDHVTAVPCLLFFDEFDSVGKERGDLQDVGEMKRVVGSLLVQLDAVPSHTIVVCASNHGELLDRAVWRRFDTKILVGLPGPDEINEWFTRFERSLNRNLERMRNEFVGLMQGESFSQIETFTLDVRRKLVLSNGALSAAEAVASGIERWTHRLRAERHLGEVDGTASNKTDRPRAAGQKKTRRPPKPAPAGELF